MAKTKGRNGWSLCKSIILKKLYKMFASIFSKICRVIGKFSIVVGHSWNKLKFVIKLLLPLVTDNEMRKFAVQHCFYVFNITNTKKLLLFKKSLFQTSIFFFICDIETIKRRFTVNVLIFTMLKCRFSVITNVFGSFPHSGGLGTDYLVG